MVTFSLIIMLLISVVAFLVALSVVIGLFVTRVPFVSSSRRDVKAIIDAMELSPGQKIYDLGCGKAQILIKACQKYQVKGVGYELSLWPYIWAKLNIWLSRAEVKIHFANFFKADLGEADMVYCYLFPEIMARLEGKFKNELRPGARVVSYAFKMPNLIPEKTIITHEDNVELGKIYIYRF